MKLYRDKIREISMLEKEHASPETGENPHLQRPRSEPQPNAFYSSLRLKWNRHSRPKPVVRRQKRSDPVFHIRQTNDYVGVAKKAVTRLDDYSQHLKPTLTTVHQARDGHTAPRQIATGSNARDGARAAAVAAPGSNAIPVPTTHPSVRRAQQNAPGGHYDASRDPRLMGRRP